MRMRSITECVPRTAKSAPETSRYIDTTAHSRPAASVHFSITAPGSMVILSPGKYTVESRCAPCASTALSLAKASTGAAI